MIVDDGGGQQHQEEDLVEVLVVLLVLVRDRARDKAKGVKQFRWKIWCRMEMVVGLSRRRRMWLILSLFIIRDFGGVVMGWKKW